MRLRAETTQQDERWDIPQTAAYLRVTTWTLASWLTIIVIGGTVSFSILEKLNMITVKPETLMCPSCRHEITTDKTVGVTYEKMATCPSCKKQTTLGDMRNASALGLLGWTAGQQIPESKPARVKSEPLYLPTRAPDPISYPPNFPTVVHHHHHAAKPSGGVAAVLSFLVPGLGQLYQGKLLIGFLWFFFVLLGYVCFIIPGIILHIACVASALSG